MDSVVGDIWEGGSYAKVTTVKIIKDGIPQIVRYGAGSKHFDNKETVREAGKTTVQLFQTAAEKLAFMQKFGFLMNDPDVRAYSARFKPQGRRK